MNIFERLSGRKPEVKRKPQGHQTLRIHNVDVPIIKLTDAEEHDRQLKHRWWLEGDGSKHGPLRHAFDIHGDLVAFAPGTKGYKEALPPRYDPNTGMGLSPQFKEYATCLDKRPLRFRRPISRLIMIFQRSQPKKK